MVTDNLGMCSRIVLLVGLLGFVFASREFYSSVAHLKHSFNYTNTLKATESLESYINAKEKQLDIIEKTVDSLKELSEEIQDPDFDLQHPLNAYRFIRNHSFVYNGTIEELFGMIKVYEKDAFNVSRFEAMMKNLPNQTDVEEIINGIFKIQTVYELNADDLAFDPEIMGGTDLITAKQCHSISERALTLETFYYARDWINLAIYLVAMRNDSTVPLDLLYEDASVIAFAAGNFKEAMDITKELLRIKPSSRIARKLYKQYESNYNAMSKEEKEEAAKLGTEPPIKTAERDHSDKLCQGMAYLLKSADKKEHNLSCWYQTNDHPLLLFQPAQLEEVSRNPFIAVYHNFLDERELISLKKYAHPRLSRSMYLKRGNDGYTSADKRISKTSYLRDHPTQISVQKRIAALTLSSEETFETFQVTNYGIGGDYKVHADQFPNRMVEEGKVYQRTSTFMVYLSDVKAGGATVFPKLNETIYPEAGKAVFWYNTLRNGLGNPLMYHVACPVIVGDKWISNQWILQEGNEFNRPCSLNERE